MAMLQGNQLTMLGLGNAATAGFGFGIHTRWHFDGALSWPKFGFDLYRRQATKGSRTCVDFRAIKFLDPKRTRFVYGAKDGTLTANSTASMTLDTGAPACVRTSSQSVFAFTVDRKIRQFSVNVVCASGSMTLKAYDGTMLVDTVNRAASGTPTTLTVTADRINRVVFTVPMAVELRQICWVPIVDGDWTKLVFLELPRDWIQASSRLHPSLPVDVRKRYEVAWPRLDRAIRKIKAGVLTETLADVSGADTAPQLAANYIHLLQMAALDPNLARMIGLYYQDETAATGSRYDYKIAGHWKAPASADHAWICFDLVRGTPPAVVRPSGLASRQVDVPGGIQGDPDSQSAAALGWTITRTAGGQLTKTAPVLYHVFREDKKPDRTWTAAQQLTQNRPVVAKAVATDARYYTDGPLALGTYRYRVAGIDIFGRQSALSTTTTVRLTDQVAPPPPIEVKAALPDPDATSPVTINVAWRWTSQQRAQAGDAKLFRVYHQYEDLYPVTGTVTAVAAGSVSDTSDLTTDLDPAGDYSRFSDGFLIHRGARYQVTDVNVAGSKLIVTVANRADASGARTVVPVAAPTSAASFAYLAFLTDAWKLKGRFLLKADWSQTTNWQSRYEAATLTAAETYTATIASVPVAVDSATPLATVMVAVCTEDAHGNVGALSVPVFVQVRNTDAPAAPVLAIGDDEYATKADWYGNSTYTLAIPTAGSGITYEIFRATDAALARAALSTTELEALNSYEDVSDADLKTWADAADATAPDLLEHRAAFTNVGTASADFTDTFPGTGRNRYVYKIRSVDAAGNRGAFTSAFVVHLYDVLPPNTPVITSVTSGDRQITLSWARNQERDLAGYRIYRTTLEEVADDIRGMDLVAEVAAGIETFAEDVVGMRDFWYRISAVDVRGNESAASQPSQVKAYDHGVPTEPTLLRAEWVKLDDDGLEYSYSDATSGLINAVAVEFSSPDFGVKALLQRMEEDTDWSNISVWSSGSADGVFVCYDATPSTDTQNIYRIRLMSCAGVILESGVTQTVEPAA
jgi:hypothetical protein